MQNPDSSLVVIHLYEETKWINPANALAIFSGFAEVKRCPSKILLELVCRISNCLTHLRIARHPHRG